MVVLNDELRNFNLVLAEIHGLYHEACVRLGISESACQVLYTIAMFGEGATPREVYRAFGTSRQTVHSAIGTLVRNGIIYLQKGPGRARGIHLTEQGQQLLHERIVPLVRLENALLGSWPEEERENLLRLLRQYRNDLRSRLVTLKPHSQMTRPASAGTGQDQ